MTLGLFLNPRDTKTAWKCSTSNNHKYQRGITLDPHDCSCTVLLQRKQEQHVSCWSFFFFFLRRAALFRFSLYVITGNSRRIEKANVHWDCPEEEKTHMTIKAEGHCCTYSIYHMRGRDSECGQWSKHNGGDDDWRAMLKECRLWGCRLALVAAVFSCLTPPRQQKNNVPHH